MSARPLPPIADRQQWVILAARRAIIRRDDNTLWTLIGIPKRRGNRARIESQDGLRQRSIPLTSITAIEHVPATNQSVLH